MGPDHLEALRRICRDLRIPSDKWHRVPALERVFTTLAVAVEERTARGVPRTFGLSQDTYESRLRRWRAEACSSGDDSSE